MATDTRPPPTDDEIAALRSEFGITSNGRGIKEFTQVREPLTDAQIRAMAREHPAEDLCGWSYRMGIADTERHHGIKGGQHGADI